MAPEVERPNNPSESGTSHNGNAAVNSCKARNRIRKPGEMDPPRKVPSAVTRSMVTAVPQSTTRTSRPGQRTVTPTAAASLSRPNVWGVR